MNEVPSCSRDVDCGAGITSAVDSTTGAGAELTAVTTAALWAATHKEQCEAGEVPPARTSCM